MNHELDNLMERFAALGDATVGRGPHHPTAPHPELQAEISTFLVDYSALRRDLAYVEFLETYAGAEVVPRGKENGLIVTLLGFQHDGSLDMNADEWEWTKELAQEQGFFVFAIVSVPSREPPASYGTLGVNFAFDITGRRKPGVYAYIENEPVVWFCDSFLTWLRRLIDTRGHLYGYLPYVMEPLNTGGRYELADELPRLMEKFAALGNAVVGQGPQHPTAPRRELQPDINRFLAKYPMLRRDPDYMAFLETYAGAAIAPPPREYSLSVLIPGFQDDHDMSVNDPEWEWEQELAKEHGFFSFATVQVRGDAPPASHGFIDMDFYFDLTGARQPGVYGGLEEAPIVWFCNSFLVWLRLLIETRGHLYGDLPGRP